jgi:hypothetical protein
MTLAPWTCPNFAKKAFWDFTVGEQRRKKTDFPVKRGKRHINRSRLTR